MYVLVVKRRLTLAWGCFFAVAEDFMCTEGRLDCFGKMRAKEKRWVVRTPTGGKNFSTSSKTIANFSKL